MEIGVAAEEIHPAYITYMIAYYISRAPRSAPAADERDCPPNRLSKHTDLNEIKYLYPQAMAFHAMRGSAHSRATSGRTVTQTIPTRSRPIRSTEALNAYMYHKRYESTPPAERMLRSTPAACAPDSALPSLQSKNCVQECRQETETSVPFSNWHSAHAVSSTLCPGSMVASSSACFGGVDERVRKQDGKNTSAQFISNPLSKGLTAPFSYAPRTFSYVVWLREMR
eukprot:CAMPEP_0181173452 /NCGR_PEP_ID=MMETSP1096-20121128/3007_1 /TAXON_ID=156174 ORGANISM="Chrysochromulina ericina, Strain CCMP281" /NCGR_SAMPLE_ID=MMETSP1096 /ASSEMBLY_ACC=CAM_ASM_000453 /LENGTH=225 /DNA_ID=CAMNT_0023261281 /DNA_START=21 /DNA_END=699 /DNA_ORIENTATION=-